MRLLACELLRHALSSSNEPAARSVKPTRNGCRECDHRGRSPACASTTVSPVAALKTYDGQGDETLLLSDSSSLHLDLIAHDRGLKGLAASLYEFGPSDPRRRRTKRKDPDGTNSRPPPSPKTVEFLCTAGSSWPPDAAWQEVRREAGRLLVVTSVLASVLLLAERTRARCHVSGCRRSTIQAAIDCDAVKDGDTIAVWPGRRPGATVTKAVTIRAPAP